MWKNRRQCDHAGSTVSAWRKDVDNFVDKQIPGREKVCRITTQHAIYEISTIFTRLESITCMLRRSRAFHTGWLANIVNNPVKDCRNVVIFLPQAVTKMRQIPLDQLSAKASFTGCIKPYQNIMQCSKMFK
jgi:hypothetical protein